MKHGAKPKNFPGRVNDRRIAALARIQDQLARGLKMTRLGAVNLTADDRARLNKDADALVLRIRPRDVARAIRTKKDRSGRVRFSQTA